MNTSVHQCRSRAIVTAIGDRGRAWRPDPITQFQFRFSVAQAVGGNAIRVTGSISTPNGGENKIRKSPGATAPWKPSKLERAA